MSASTFERLAMRFIITTVVTLLAVHAVSADEPTVAATVNGEEIRLADVDRLFRLAPKGAPPLTTSMMQSLRRTAVEDLIDDVLIRQFLVKQKIVVDTKEVDEQVHVLTERL